jgi:hypothetical protein
MYLSTYIGTYSLSWGGCMGKGSLSPQSCSSLGGVWVLGTYLVYVGMYRDI